MSERVKVGDKAPLFSLLSEEGETLYLSGLIGKSPIVLYFYPKDNTSVCTKEACAFRDRFSELSEIHGALVFGISSDSVESHKQFSMENELPFTLLSDPRGRVRKLYGVPKTLGLFPGRVTYVIDRDGVVGNIFSSQLNYQKHVDESLEALKLL